MEDNSKQYLLKLCYALGLNTAHDWDGIASLEDEAIYKNAVLRKISELQEKALRKTQQAEKDNILYRANQIVNERSEEKARQYGPFDESMDRMRDLFNAMTGLSLTTEHMFKAMIALKLSRESYSHKEDNLLDCVSYIGALDNYLKAKELKNS
jgi:hypothetical protein